MLHRCCNFYVCFSVYEANVWLFSTVGPGPKCGSAALGLHCNSAKYICKGPHYCIEFATCGDSNKGPVHDAATKMCSAGICTEGECCHSTHRMLPYTLLPFESSSKRLHHHRLRTTANYCAEYTSCSSVNMRLVDNAATTACPKGSCDNATCCVGPLF